MNCSMNWDWRNRGPEAIIGGATGVVVVALYLVCRAWLDEVGSEAWLNFAGIILGVTATIGGTFAIKWISDQLAEQRIRNNIVAAIDDVIFGIDFSNTQAAQSAGRWDRVMAGWHRIAQQTGSLPHL